MHRECWTHFPKTRKITPLTILLPLVTIAWKCSQLGTQHTEGFCHTRISFQNQSSALSGCDLVYTGTRFSSVLMQQIRITAATLKWLLPTHLCFCPRAALWQLFVWPVLKQIVEPVKLKKNTGKKESFLKCICTWIWLAIQLCQQVTRAQQMRDEWKWAGGILLLKEEQCNSSQRPSSLSGRCFLLVNTQCRK